VQLTVDAENALLGAAEEIIKYSEDQLIWIFYGEMGAGKTTLIKAIAEQYAVEDNVHSPTFSLVNEYRNHENKIFYHFDFYRINNETEAMDIGVDEYFDSGDYCFIEWPQKIPSLLPDRFLKIEILITSETSRKITLSHHGR
jgi:tRNA threonylcarbamoyladenosine biosynthesis protein TsaE